MALAGKGVLAIWNGIAEEAESEFLSWHVREHIPERVAVPGFLKARRYVAVRGVPKYFNFYETETPADLGSPAYLARLNAPSDWTKRVVRHFSDTSRTACDAYPAATPAKSVGRERIRTAPKSRVCDRSVDHSAATVRLNGPFRPSL